MMLLGNRQRTQIFQAAMRRKFPITCVVALLAFFLFNPRPYNVSYNGVIHGVDPAVVWEFMADFNNIMKLNPTIENFSITYDKGEGQNYWEYGVHYAEHLSSFPFIKNAAHAVYKIYKTEEPTMEYTIESAHRTCFVGAYLCVDSTSKFICKQHGYRLSDTYCQEDVTYECPRIGSPFCYREVMYQRRAIFANLILELTST